MRWELTDHVCRECAGRILRAADGDSFRCADCGRHEFDLEDVCCCGMQGVGSARLRCTPNITGRPMGAPEIVVEISTAR